METLIYLILGAVVYGIVADHTDHVVEREMRARQRPASADLQPVEDFGVRPDLRRIRRWIVPHHARVRRGVGPRSHGDLGSAG